MTRQQKSNFLSEGKTAKGQTALRSTRGHRVEVLSGTSPHVIHSVQVTLQGLLKRLARLLNMQKQQNFHSMKSLLKAIM